MHDLDRVSMEAEAEAFEMWGEGEWGEVLGEAELQEMASELLSVNSEAELDRFLGGLLKKAASAAGAFLKGPMGQQLGGLLKGAAKKLLPMAGQAIGNMVAPGQGGAAGAQLAAKASEALGLELEGLSHEDREFEVAQQFVRFAADATRRATAAARGAHPAAAAREAVAGAAERFAPGLLASEIATRPPAAPSTGAATSGHWVRHGRHIVIHGI
jgi:hypothetical protein